MSKIVDGPSLFSKEGRVGLGGMNSKYDWSVLLDGKKRLLEWGKDFNVEVTSFRMAAHYAAKRRGYRVAVVRGEKPGTILFQAEKIAK